MTGAGSVAALVLLEWSVGWIGASAWSQSWGVIRRGHFRITAAITLVLGLLAALSVRSATSPSLVRVLALLFVVAAAFYLLLQYARSDVPGITAGSVAAVLGIALLVAAAGSVHGWPQYLAAMELVVGAGLLGAVTNGMMLGHWYLNQPGLKPWALARLTDLSLAAIAGSALTGLLAVRLLASASTRGAGLGLSGLDESFGVAFYVVWSVLIVFTAAVVLGARRCIEIRSIQSATGLYYVALLTAGVAEFLVRYLMVNAT
jgi:hypothetical protein